MLPAHAVNHNHRFSFILLARGASQIIETLRSDNGDVHANVVTKMPDALLTDVLVAVTVAVTVAVVVS